MSYGCRYKIDARGRTPLFCPNLVGLRKRFLDTLQMHEKLVPFELQERTVRAFLLAIFL